MPKLNKLKDGNYYVTDEFNKVIDGVNESDEKITNLGRELVDQQINMMAFGGDLVDRYNNSMKDGDVAGFYTYSAQSSNGWPETASNNNTIVIFKMAASYGLAISMCGSNAYMARVTVGGFNWRKLN